MASPAPQYVVLFLFGLIRTGLTSDTYSLDNYLTTNGNPTPVTEGITCGLSKCFPNLNPCNALSLLYTLYKYQAGVEPFMSVPSAGINPRTPVINNFNALAAPASESFCVQNPVSYFKVNNPCVPCVPKQVVAASFQCNPAPIPVLYKLNNEEPCEEESCEEIAKKFAEYLENLNASLAAATKGELTVPNCATQVRPCIQAQPIRQLLPVICQLFQPSSGVVIPPLPQLMTHITPATVPPILPILPLSTPCIPVTPPDAGEDKCATSDPPSTEAPTTSSPPEEANPSFPDTSVPSMPSMPEIRGIGFAPPDGPATKEPPSPPAPSDVPASPIPPVPVPVPETPPLLPPPPPPPVPALPSPPAPPLPVPEALVDPAEPDLPPPPPIPPVPAVPPPPVPAPPPIPPVPAVPPPPVPAPPPIPPVPAVPPPPVPAPPPIPPAPAVPPPPVPDLPTPPAPPLPIPAPLVAPPEPDLSAPPVPDIPAPPAPDLPDPPVPDLPDPPAPELPEPPAPELPVSPASDAPDPVSDTPEDPPVPDSPASAESHLADAPDTSSLPSDPVTEDAITPSQATAINSGLASEFSFYPGGALPGNGANDILTENYAQPSYGYHFAFSGL